LEQELGVISILVASKNSNINKIYGFEIQKEMAEMANRSVKINSLNDKIEIVNEDIVGLSKRNWNKKFDVVISNPPYKKVNTGLVNKEDKKLISRHEVKCKLEELIFETSKILKDNGNFYMVHRPERLVDICYLMRENKIEPKEVRFVYPHINDEANLVLIKGVKCGKPSVKLLKPLIVYNENGEYSDEIYKIYSKNRA
jgi:tRNA1Val (adenine37-N6)-methyltransferase